MKESELRLASPCGMDFRKMTPAEGGRLCVECRIVVRDLSSMSEADARALLTKAGEARLCVRYLYDETGRVVFAGAKETEHAAIVPAYRLTAKAKARLARAALLVAPFVLFEACGGGAGDVPTQNWQREAAAPEVDEAGGGDADAGNVPDAAGDGGPDQ